MNPIETIKTAWSALDAWLEANARDSFDALAPPASPDALRALEQQVGGALAPDLVQSLRQHDGERDELGAIGHWILMSAAQIRDAHANCLDVPDELVDVDDDSGDTSPEIRSQFYNHKWIPFLRDQGGDYSCVDHFAGRLGSRWTGHPLLS